MERSQKTETIANLTRMAIFEGDFVAAERSAREYEALVASNRRHSAHGSAASVLAKILDETGRPGEAARTALDFLDRRDAWEPDPSGEDVALAHDATPGLLRAALRGGSLSHEDAVARRESWRRAWGARITPVSRNFLWMYAFARVVDTEEDAREAVAALPAYGPLPPFRPGTRVEVDVARTFLLAGRADDALPLLEHATRMCMVLHFPFDHMRARLLLAETREARGDTAGACRDYQTVVSRWGRANPSSVTAATAAERRRSAGVSALKSLSGGLSFHIVKERQPPHRKVTVSPMRGGAATARRHRPHPSRGARQRARPRHAPRLSPGTGSGAADALRPCAAARARRFDST